jgi:hypothetical protein
VRAVPAAACLPVNGRRLPRGGNVDLVPVAGRRGEVDPGRIGLRTQAARQFDRSRVPVAKLQMVEAGPAYRARDVDDHLPALRRLTRPVRLTPIR